MINSVTLRRPDDMHVHLREGQMLKNVAPYTAKQFGHALIMPNLSKPVLTGADVIRYRTEILHAAPSLHPMMTIKLVPSTTPDTIIDAISAGAVAGKLYPEGVTTNSEDGVSDIKAMYPVFDAMQRHDMVLCLHGETPNAFCLDREEAFLHDLRDISKKFPYLRIVLEHVTTEAAVEVVKHTSNVFATITAHHLLITLDDVIGGKLNVHNFCKPIAKRPSDRFSLLKVVFENDPKFFLGTDSAPHMKETKECASGCAGCYTAPLAIELVALAHEQAGVSLDRMSDFISRFGSRFYRFQQNSDSISLKRETWTVPLEYDGVVPFMAGQKLPWKLDV